MSTSAPMTAHVAAASATGLSILNLFTTILPPILAGLASFCAVCWYAVQVYESRPIQAWLAKHRKPVGRDPANE